jgi:hypothetical protein
MIRYKKEIDGQNVIKFGKDIVVKKDGMMTINPSEEMILADGWEVYVAPSNEPTAEELLEQAKEEKLRELHEYDESAEVNDCIIVYQGQELHYWADKHERGSLGSAVSDCIALGRASYRLDLRELGVSLSIPCEMLLQMLAVLEVYAIDCYNKTTDHEFAIKAMTSVSEIDAYEFRVGYPPIPRFEL